MSLHATNLSKSYSNGIKALDKLSIEIGVGMFGLLGPNGAGKSTFMRILATLQLPDEGQVTFSGIDILKDPYSLRMQLGYLPQSFGVYPKETAKSLLHYMAVLKGIVSKKERGLMVDDVLHRTNLTDVRNTFVSEYSGGMKQRFGIAQVLLNRPKLIIVDEPTAGLDPSERNRFLNVLRTVGSENIVILSTHIVADVRELCHNMAIIHHGQIIKHQPPQSSIADIEGFIWHKKVSENELEAVENRFLLLSKSFSDDNRQDVRIFSKEQPGEGFQSSSPTLEDVYFLTLKKAG